MSVLANIFSEDDYVILSLRNDIRFLSFITDNIFIMDTNYPMEIFLTCAGFILGISAFLYCISLLDSGKRKIKSFSNDKKIVNKRIPRNPKDSIRSDKPISPQVVAQYQELKNGVMPQRVCPMCGKSLMRDEPLYATHMEIGKEKKVYIHGCPYCYKSAK